MSWFDLGVLLATFAVIFPAELPDKSFIATLVLATRFPRLLVWLGATLAFGIQMVIAVAVGRQQGEVAARLADGDEGDHRHAEPEQPHGERDDDEDVAGGGVEGHDARVSAPTWCPGHRAWHAYCRLVALTTDPRRGS